MANGRPDRQRGADESGRQLGDQFLVGIELRAESPGVVPVQSARMAGPVTKLMEQGPVVVDLLEESGLRRDVDGIVRRKIERLRAADTDIGAGCRGERPGLRSEE